MRAAHLGKSLPDGHLPGGGEDTGGWGSQTRCVLLPLVVLTKVLWSKIYITVNLYLLLDKGVCLKGVMRKDGNSDRDVAE